MEPKRESSSGMSAAGPFTCHGRHRLPSRSMVSPSILLVEDDEAIASGLVRVLGGQGYAVRHVSEGRHALASSQMDVALVLLDLGLPDMDGTDLCRALRARHPDLTIVILTARDAEPDIVAGLDAGADDYLVKPVRLSELLARIRAHLRRRDSAVASGELIAGALRIDPAARRVWMGPNELQLRPREYELLELLVRDAGCVVTRDRIMRQVWDTEWLGATKSLDTHILSLRTKLDDPSAITTLRGIGYRFDLS